MSEIKTLYLCRDNFDEDVFHLIHETRVFRGNCAPPNEIFTHITSLDGPMLDVVFDAEFQRLADTLIRGEMVRVEFAARFIDYFLPVEEVDTQEEEAA